MSDSTGASHRAPYNSNASPIDFEAVAALVRKVQAGDMAAFSRLYNMYVSQVYYAALKYLKNEDDAAEITQEVFLRVHSNISNLKSPVAFHKWINTITYHLSLNAREKKESRQGAMAEKDFTAYEEMLPEENEEFLPEELLTSREKQADVLEVVDSLPSAQRSSVVMHYFEGLSVPEIAEITEQAPDTIHKRLYDAKKTLRKKLRLSPDFAPVHLSAGAAPVLTQILKKDADSATTQQVRDTISRKLSSALIRTGQTTTASQAPEVAGVAKTALGPAGKIFVTGAVTASVALGGFLAYNIATKRVEPTPSQTAPAVRASASVETTGARTAARESEEPTQKVEPKPKPTKKSAQESNPRRTDRKKTVEEVVAPPTISLAQKSVTYQAGEHPGLDTIIEEAGVFAFDSNGKRLEVTAKGYEWIDFDEVGAYKLFLDARDKQNQSARTAILTIEIQP